MVFDTGPSDLREGFHDGFDINSDGHAPAGSFPTTDAPSLSLCVRLNSLQRASKSEPCQLILARVGPTTRQTGSPPRLLYLKDAGAGLDVRAESADSSDALVAAATEIGHPDELPFVSDND